MDNRTSFRRRGPAFLADEARRALGLAIEQRPLADIPPPLVHTALGAAICAVAVLLRPDALGLTRSAAASAALAVAAGALLAAYDRLIYPAPRRPPLSSVALPVAAVGAFATVLAGTRLLAPQVAAGVVAALVIGGVPQLVARSLAAGDTVGRRLMRDVAGAAVLAPVFIAGASPILPTAARMALVAAMTALVTYDGLRSDQLGAAPASLLAAALGVVVAGTAYLVGPSATDPGARAAVLLLLWYGLRGVAAAPGAGSRRQGALLAAEYATFVVLAASAMRWLLPVT